MEMGDEENLPLVHYYNVSFVCDGVAIVAYTYMTKVWTKNRILLRKNEGEQKGVKIVEETNYYILDGSRAVDRISPRSGRHCPVDIPCGVHLPHNYD